MTRRSIGPAALLGNAAFRRVWLSGALSNVNRWLEFLAVGVWVFDRTGSAFTVTLMVVLRMLPLALFGALVGAVAERADRRLLVMAGQGASIAVSLAAALLAASGRLELWHVAAAAFANGMVWATEMPLRRTMLGDIAGEERVAPAMALDTATNNATRMLGPLAGGALLEAFGIAGAFAAGAAMNLAGIAMLAGLRAVPASRGGDPAGLFATLRDGFRYVRSNRPLLATLAVTVVFNLWGFPATSLVPVIGKDVLGLSAFPVGALQSCEGVGALVGALAVAWYGRSVRFRLLYAAGVACYMAFSFVFALSPWFLVSGMMLVGAGIGGACFASMQSTLTFLDSRPEMRNRAMGMLMVCIGTAPLGFLHLGFMADWLGAQAALAIVALEGLFMLALVLLLWPEARR